MQDAGVYTGEAVKQRTRNGEEVHVRHGRGTYTFANGTFTYTGEWVHGQMHGQGVLSVGGVASPATGQNYTSAPHSVLEGTFVRGEATGRGTKRWADGTNYSGEFRSGEMHGQGIYQGLRSKFEGAFKNDMRDGAGTLQCGPGTEFHGEWFQGKKNGHGLCRWESGASFEGQYAFDLREGNGVERHADGSYYDGSFSNDLRSGAGTFVHAASGLRIDGNFKYGQPLLTPFCLKVRIAKPAELSAEAAPDVTSGRSGSRGEKRSADKGVTGESPRTKSGSDSKLSKKKQEELRRAEEELAAYHASLTEGVILLDGQPLPVIDEARVLTLTPGHKIPLFYLCACSRDGTVATSESGRELRLTLRMHPVTQSSDPDAASSRSRANADAPDLDGDDAPIVAFCTCPGAHTVPWSPKPPDADAEAAAADERSSSSGSGKKKKPSSSSKSKRRSVVEVDGPPPPFVCNGACVRDQAVRSEWSTILTRQESGGWSLLDEVWLSGACTPGLHLDLVVEDVTPGVEAVAASSISSPVPRSARRRLVDGDELGPPPTSLRFRALAPYTLPLLMAGVLPKRKKSKKPVAPSKTASSPKLEASPSPSPSPKLTAASPKPTAAAAAP